jgi:hypothetical protein
MFDEVFSQGPCAAQAFAGAIGEWHCALASAHAASSTEPPAEVTMTLQSSAHGADGVPGPLCFASFAVPVAGVGKKVEIQARIKPVNASWDACAVASASVHQWLGTRIPAAQARDPRYLDGFVGVFAEVAPHTGQVNHSKPVQYTVCSMAPPVSHAGQISSDGDRDHPPKGRALGRSSWLTALPIPVNCETSSPWAFDVQLYPPAPHARCDRAPHDFSRAVVAILATGDVAGVHVARGMTPSAAAATTPRGGRFRHGASRDRMNTSCGSVGDASHRPRLSPVPAGVVFRRPRDEEEDDAAAPDVSQPHFRANELTNGAGNTTAPATDTSLLQALAQQEEDDEEENMPHRHANPEVGRPADGDESEPAARCPTADASRAASSTPGGPSAEETRAAELEAENCRLRVELERVVAQRDAAIASSNAARREIDVVESAVVEPLKAEVSELRRLVSRYHAAVAALSGVVDDCADDAVRSEADAVRVRGDVERLYTTLGIDL